MGKTSPISVVCPYCGAKPGEDREKRSSGFATIHVARIGRAADIDAHNLKRERSNQDSTPSPPRVPRK